MTRKLWSSRWKYGWILTGAGLAAGAIFFGAYDNWSSTAVLVIGIGLAAYLAFPPMIASLKDLGREIQQTTHTAPLGARLTWDPGLTDVARELAAAFDTIDEAQDVGAAGGVRMERVRSSRRPDMYWQQLLTRALDEGAERLDRVLDEALAKSARVSLHEAVQRYRSHREP